MVAAASGVLSALLYHSDALPLSRVLLPNALSELARRCAVTALVA
jgi:hypothetical protein